MHRTAIIDDPYGTNNEYKESTDIPDYQDMTVQALGKTMAKKIKHGEFYKLMIVRDNPVFRILFG